jgi:hypothetical protein
MPTRSDIREINSRTNAGITVTMFGHFSPVGECDYIIVEVDSPTANFTISEIPKPLALDVYSHPFVYASRELASGTLRGNVVVSDNEERSLPDRIADYS